MNLIPEIKLSSRYLISDKAVQSIQLHMFCDTFKKAYGSVTYLRFTLKLGTHICAFIMAKYRLAPLNTITLPRLELNAPPTGARLSRLIVHEVDLPIDKVVY